ncbi:MAG: CAP domain-containing protein, partial [Bacteroidota bacterium]
LLLGFTQFAPAQTSITLFIQKGENYSEAAQTTLNEKNIPFEAFEVSTKAGKSRLSELLEKDPGIYPITHYQIKQGFSITNGWFAGYNAVDELLKSLHERGIDISNPTSFSTSSSNDEEEKDEKISLSNVPSPSNRPTGNNPSANSGDFKATMLKEHNYWRAQLGITPLKWSRELAVYAQEWANELKRRGCELEHRPRNGQFTQKYGENLYYGYKGFHGSPQDATDSWASERKYFNFETLEWDWRDSGHYTQMIWENTTEVGCAKVECTDANGTRVIWVCNYNPAGNYPGTPPYQKK